MASGKEKYKKEFHNVGSVFYTCHFQMHKYTFNIIIAD